MSKYLTPLPPEDNPRLVDMLDDAIRALAWREATNHDPLIDVQIYRLTYLRDQLLAGADPLAKT